MSEDSLDPGQHWHGADCWEDGQSGTGKAMDWDAWFGIQWPPTGDTFVRSLNHPGL